MIPFYIATSDSTLHILKATTYLYNKYWGNDQEFKILGNSPPNFELPKNFEFIKIKNDNNIENWSFHIYNYIKNNEKGERFIFTLDDYSPNKYLDVNVYKKMINMMENDKKIGIFKLGISHNKFDEIVDLDDNFYKLKQNASYRIVCQTSIWEKNYFLSFFENNWTPWEFENGGSSKSKNDGFEIMGYKPPPFDWVVESSLSSRYPDMINILGMNKEDVKYFIENKIFDENQLQYGFTLFHNIKFKDVGYDLNLWDFKNKVDEYQFNILYDHYNEIYKV